MIDTQAIRNRILFLALSGQLVKQDPSDIPAEEFVSVLSERLNAKPFISTISEDETPFKIPNSWLWCHLSDIGSTNIGLTYHPEDTSDKGTIVARSSNIVDGKMDYSDLVRVTCQIRDNQFLDTNDILICARNGSKALVGKCAIYEGAPKAVAFGAFMAVFRTPLFRYVYYYFNTPVFKRNFVSDDSKQINQVTQAILKQSLIPVPPVEEQKRIVEKIEQTFSVLDTIDELQAQYADNLTVLKSKLIDLAIQGKLTEQLPEDGTAEELYQQIQAEKLSLIKAGKIKKEKPLPEIEKNEIPFEIPKNWCWCRLISVFNFIDYRGATPNKISEGVPFVTAKNVRQGHIDYSIAEFISEDDYQMRQSRGISHKGDLLFTTEAPMGYAAIADLDRFSAGQRLITLQQYTEIPLLENKYYMYAISVPFFQNQLDAKCSGTTVKGIKAERLKTFVIPLPPLAEQKLIVERLDQILAVCDEMKVK